MARTVRALRNARGWSMDSLCARAGVSKGVLVALEQGHANPNLVTLIRLAEAFGVPLTRLVQVDEVPAVQVVAAERAVVLWQGEAGGTGTLLLGTDAPEAMELWRWVMQPGESYGGDGHAAGTRELVTVERGELSLVAAGEDHRLPAGSSASFAGDRPHTYANEGGAPVSFVMVVTVPQPPAPE
ncbi:MAG: helix-turn-helix domain-containing protein [Acidimicrobiales bacterium]